MTRVACFPADLNGCGMYRVVWPARILKDEGYDVSVFPPGEQDALPIEESIIGGLGTVRLLERPEFDVVIIQRPLHWHWREVIPQLQRYGIKVVCELDDDVAEVHPNHAAYRAMHPSYSEAANWVHCEVAMGLADRAVVSTEALANRYGNGRAIVVPNHVRRKVIAKEPNVRVWDDVSQAVVGWTGSVRAHPGDLSAPVRSVGNLQGQLGFKFMVVGSGDGVRGELGLRAEPVVQPYVPIDSYHESITAFDVGIAPLLRSRFNESKSFLKPLEYSARGVPFVCTPTTPYTEFCRMGAGVLAETPKDWERSLRRLLSDLDYRVELGAAGLKAARRFVMEDNIDRWAKAWYLK